MPSETKSSTPAPSRWRLGPSHPDYDYSGARGYPVLTRDSTPIRAPRRSQRTTGKAGSIMGRRFTLTARGAAAATTVSDTAWSGRCAQNAAAVPSGHSACPPSIRHLCEGNLPAGWVRSSEVAG